MATPVTTPVPDTTDAMDGEPELHTPPAVASDNVVVLPTHTESVPVMSAGSELIVTMAVMIQPVEGSV